MPVLNVNNKKPLLECKKLQVEICNKIICDDLNITFNPTEVWGVLGRNGSGKTSLLHTLAGLHPAKQGEIFLHQKNINNLSRKKIAQQLGILLQHNNDSFPCSVLESALLGRHPHIDTWQWESNKDKNIALDALKQVEMQQYALRSTEHLSGGEQQRVAIAALISQTPDIFLLDEPDSHLDLHYQIKLLGDFYLTAKEHHKLVIMCIHDINLAARYCDHFLMLYGDGQYIVGHKDDILNTQTLSMVYQHPFEKIQNKDHQLFIPA